ncbi:MAG TPA: hypothetical protein VIX87_08600 [Steroidobacteraceae bacterium]
MNTQSHDARTTLAITLMALGLGLMAFAPMRARADVTVDQQTSMSVAGMNIDITSVELTSADKQRRDTTTQCHGILALVCHDVQSGEIVRLDKELEWQLQPKKKVYAERTFPTPEQRAMAQQKLQETMDEMKKCPVPQSQSTPQSGPDTSHCQMSPPNVTVNQSDEHAALVGHDTRKSSVVIAQSCTDTQTGDVCEIDYGFDVWLTTDTIAGMDERRAFAQHYMAAQGLDLNNPQLQGAMQQFMAPYADALKQLQSKSSDLKGYPLRTTFYMAFGGPHCGKAQQAQKQQASGGTGLGLRGIAANAISGGLTGMFHHSVNPNTSTVGGAVAANAADQTADNAANATANAATRAPTPTPTPASATPSPDTQMQRVVTMTNETRSIDTSSISSGQFEIPTGWTLQVPQAAKDRQFTCPTSKQ